MFGYAWYGERVALRSLSLHGTDQQWQWWFSHIWTSRDPVTHACRNRYKKAVGFGLVIKHPCYLLWWLRSQEVAIAAAATTDVEVCLLEKPDVVIHPRVIQALSWAIHNVKTLLNMPSDVSFIIHIHNDIGEQSMLLRHITQHTVAAQSQFLGVAGVRLLGTNSSGIYLIFCDSCWTSTFSLLLAF